MTMQKTAVCGIPAILWGEPAETVCIHVHGKMSRKEYAQSFSEIAEEKGMQTLSFDLPEHGERANDHSVRCDVFNGARELRQIAEYAFSRWKRVSLFACSLGAYFALNAYADTPFEKCLFQSPIVDMEWLVKHMMAWANVTEDMLEAQREIETPIDLLRWDYYQYILSHPVTEWKHETRILYGAKDELQPISSLRAFAESFGAELTVSENSSHPFMEETDAPIVENWLRRSL